MKQKAAGLLLTILLLSVYGFCQTFSKGAKVEIEWSGAWYKGAIVDTKGGQYLVSYDGYSESWNEWVTAKRLRPVNATPKATPKTASKSTTKTATKQTGATKAPASKSAPANPPMGEYAAYQWNGQQYAYQHRFTLKPNGQYHQYDNDKGTYTYNAKTKLIQFKSGPLKGFVGLYYTQGRNNDRNEPMIALDFNGNVPDLENAALSSYQYAHFRPGGVK